MEHYPIRIAAETFDVKDYAHDETNSCHFYVYRSGNLVATYKPDRDGILQPCSNEGALERELLCAIADEIEKVNF